MPSIERPGAWVHYEASGEGPPLLLGHSLFGDGSLWKDVLPGLARRFRVFAVDARGHGGSTYGAPFTLSDLATDWLAVMDREQVQSARLCGVGLGGMTALRLALAEPSRVGALALLGTSADPEATLDRVGWLLLAELQRATGLVRPLAPLLERKLFAATTRRERPELVRDHLARIVEKDPRGTFGAVQAVFRRNGVLDRVGAIRCPTLLIAGEEDATTPLAATERLASALPGAELKRLPRTGHLSPIESAPAVESALLGFL